MAHMISTGMSIHWVKRIEASSFTDGALRLAFHGDPDASQDQSNVTDVTVFMDDDELVKRLVEAINSCRPADVDPALTPHSSAVQDNDYAEF